MVGELGELFSVVRTGLEAAFRVLDVGGRCPGALAGNFASFFFASSGHCNGLAGAPNWRQGVVSVFKATEADVVGLARVSLWHEGVLGGLSETGRHEWT